MTVRLSPAEEAFIYDHAEENVQTLALQGARYPEVDISKVIVQIAARQKARFKLPTWWSTSGVIYPPQLSMEQCSSEVTAHYKASLIPTALKEGGLTDLSGGFGIDFCCMAKGFRQSTYVERQESLCLLAQHNFPLQQLAQAQIIHGDAVEYLQTMPEQKVIFIDPARRDSQGHKISAISDCEPDVSQIYPLLAAKAEWIMIKFSPMLDITQALQQLKDTREVHIVAVNGECKELLLILHPQKEQTEDIRIFCANLPTTPDSPYPSPFLFTPKEEEDSQCHMATAVSTFLYEPNAAILKAGAFRTIAQRYDLQKLHSNSHLYTSDQFMEDFPGRIFKVIRWGGFSKHEIKGLQSAVPKANLTIRNFPSTVADLRKRLKIQEGGNDYLFATTLSANEKVWIHCHKPHL